MNPKAVLEFVIGKGINLFLEEGKLKFKAPVGAMTSEIKSLLKEHKSELITLLDKRFSTTNKQINNKIQKASAEIKVLSSAQKRLLFIDTLQSGSPEYNMVCALQVEGELDLVLVNQVFNEIIKRHQILRTTYPDNATNTIFEVASNWSFSVQTYHLPGEENENKRAELIKNEVQVPFDLKNDLMIRASYIATNDTSTSSKGILLLTMHHIASDGWSIDVLQQEFFTLYQAFSQSLVSPLPSLNIQYSDYANWQNEIDTSEQISYWQQHLSDVPSCHQIPLDMPRGNIKQHIGQSVLSHFSTTQITSIQLLAQKYRLTPFMLMHAILALVLSRHSNQNDIVVGTPIANRNQSELMPLIGFFANTMILRVNTDHTNFDSYFSYIRQTHLDAQSHQDVPFELLVEKLEIPREQSFTPLFQIMLNMKTDFNDNKSALNQSLAGVSFVPLLLDTVSAKFDISVDIELSQTKGTINWVFDRSVFTKKHIEQINLNFNHILENLVTNLLTTDIPQNHFELIDIPFLSDIETLQLAKQGLEQLNYDKNLHVHQLVEQQAKTNPDALALICQNEQLTYQELNEKANQLAHYIKEKGINLEDRVGVCVSRSVNMVVTLLAIMKSGAAYVPIDSEYPKQRQEFIFKDSGIKLLLTESDISCTVAPSIERVDIDKIDFTFYPLFNVNSNIFSDNLVYLIYTSGSTGLPKAVAVAHEQLSMHIQCIGQEYEMTPDDCELQFASISFDGAHERIWTPLAFGSTLMPRDNEIWTPEQTFEKIKQYGVTIACFTPSYLHQFAQTIGEKGAQLPVRSYTVGGEAMSKDAFDYIQSTLSTARIINGYGPTETVVTPAISKYYLGDTFAAAYMPIGNAVGDRQAYLLDENLNLLPKGVIGELYFSGGLARGYFGRPDLSAEKFFANPFCDQGSRLYRTGDIARWNEQGLLEYFGRIDDQVKIRGFRIELGEIEHKLSQHELVDSALVVAKKMPSGINQLIGYAKVNNTLISDSQFVINQIKGSLTSQLPEHMIPAAFVLVDQWPLTPNGKIDKKALPEADHAITQQEYIAPITKAEQDVVDICAQLFAIDAEKISTVANFFELGGHSLLLMELSSKLKVLGYDSAISTLFNAVDLADIAKLLVVDSQVETYIIPDNQIPFDCDYITPSMLPLIALEQQDIDNIASKVPGGMNNIQDIYPLAPLQEGVLFIHGVSESEKSDPYVTPNLFEIENKTALNAFITGFEYVIARHDVLRTAILWRDRDLAVQVVLKEIKLPLTELNFPADADIYNSMKTLSEPQNQWLDIEQAPLFGLKVTALPDSDKYLVLLQAHHLISDHVTLEIIQYELAMFAQNRQVELSTPALYRDFIAHTQQQEKSLDSHQFFSKKLGDIDEPTLPYGIANVRSNGADINELKLQLNDELSSEIRNLAKIMKLSPAAIFHGAWAMVLSACTGRDDVVFGTVMSGRLQGMQNIESMLGMFINTLPIRINLNQSVKAYIEKIAHDLIALIPYEQTSLGESQRCSGLKSDVPLFSGVLNYRHSKRKHSAELGSVFKFLSGQERTNYPFGVAVDDLSDDFLLCFHIHQSVEINTVAQYMQTALKNLLYALQNNSGYAQDLTVLSEDEHQKLQRWNNSQFKYEKNISVFKLVENQAEISPDNIALICNDLSMTYQMLNDKANQLAHYLIKSGVKLEDRIGVSLNRSSNMVIALLAIMKSGAAYVPLDPNYPEHRQHFIAKDANLALILTESGLSILPAMQGKPKLINLDQLDLSFLRNENPEVTIYGDNLVYLIYTSGSTGTPKAVAVSHQELSMHIQCIGYEYEMTPDDCELQFASINFDGAHERIWTPLAFGSTLLPRDNELWTPEQAFEKMKQHGVTIACFTPSYLHQFAQTMGEKGAQLPVRSYTVGGEAMSKDAFDYIQDTLSTARIINGYGPTETVITPAISKYYRGESFSSAYMPIGQAVGDRKAYVLDSNLNLVPLGVVGELYFSGGLARGYFGRADLTAEKFIANPFCNDGSRLYRTGDLASWNEKGELDYIGRTDDQVKIRGFRIELGEIEHQLTLQKQVNSALLMAQTEESGLQQLVAYIQVTTQQNTQVLTSELRESLKAKLPDYMMPSKFIVIDFWPLTPNGKVDKKALPAADFSATQESYVAAVTKTEQIIVTIWSELLNIKSDILSAEANFFELGGHSLLSMQLVSKVSQLLAFELPLKAIFEYNTIKSLSAYIDSNQTSLNNITENCDYKSQALVMMNGNESDKLSLYCVPGVGGLANTFSAISKTSLSSIFNIAAFHHRGILDELAPYSSIADNAKQFVFDIYQQQAVGPFYIMGHSYGGAIALEMVKQLKLDGHQAHLVFLDTIFDLKTYIKPTRNNILRDEIKLNKAVDKAFIGRIENVYDIQSKLFFSYEVTPLQDIAPLMILAKETDVDQSLYLTALNDSLQHALSYKVVAGDHFTMLTQQGAEQISDAIISYFSVYH